MNSRWLKNLPMLVSAFLVGCAPGNDTIRINAHVVDKETGQVLTGVKASITERRGSLLAQDFVAKKNAYQMVDGTFKHTCASCLSVTVLFRADGYYSERRVYVRPEDQVHGDAPEADVIMERHGEYVTLYDYIGRVIASEHASDTVVVPVGPRPRNDITLTRLLEKTDDSTEPLPPYLELSVAVHSDGTIRTQPHPRVRDINSPVRPVLAISTQESGLIPYSPTESHIHLIRREMRWAPDSGYQPTLELDPDADTWFFARIGDRYGMGRVTGPVVVQTEDGIQVQASVLLHVNPDGSRNLNSRRASP